MPARLRLTAVSGQTRNRSSLRCGSGASPNRSRGGCRNRTVTSVAVTVMHLPARIRMGTSAHRQESDMSRRATKVSTVEWGSTPATS